MVWGYLGSEFPNILSAVELDKLMTSELPMYGTLEDPEEDVSVDEWFAHVSEVELSEE